MVRRKKIDKNLKVKESASRRTESAGSRFDISQETKNSIWGILSLSLAVLSILSFAGKAGTAGQLFNIAARSFFGWGFFIIPVAFVILGASFIKSISRQIYHSAVFGTALFVFSFLALFYIFGGGNFDIRLTQGGYLGIVLGFPLLRSVGFLASLLILLVLIVIAMLVALNIPIHRLLGREEKEQELVDRLVIKRGNEVIDEKKPQTPKPAPVAKPVRQVHVEPEREFVIKNLKRGRWTLPPLDLLNDDQEQALTGDINASANIIKRTLANFGIEVEMGEVSVGPTVTQFTLRPAVGVKLSRIGALNSDLSLALASHPIRIEAPIPGKSLVGIEVPNRKMSIVGLRGMFEHEEYKKSKYFMPLALGKDVSGSPAFAGLEKMPHFLIAGATGTGKSVNINSILLSLLYKHSPDVLKLMLIDPKRVELTLYNGIPHLITPVITDNKKVLGALKWAVSEMDKRYDQLSATSSRDIFSYNAKMSDKTHSTGSTRPQGGTSSGPQSNSKPAESTSSGQAEPIMPLLVIVIDELADLMASYGRDVEAAIVRLAQMSRAVGIHLIVSTQRPSVEVITGLIKANITSRIAFQVASQVDSRTILDMAGAEKLLGRGDMLFMAGDVAKPRRLQGALVTEREVKDVVKFLKTQEEAVDIEDEDELKVDFNAQASMGGHGFGSEDDADDELYNDAKEVIVLAGKASASLLQRRLKVGYARAARLLDILEEKGVVGPGDGAKPREVYIRSEGVPIVEATGISADPAQSSPDGLDEQE